MKEISEKEKLRNSKNIFNRDYQAKKQNIKNAPKFREYIRCLIEEINKKNI